MNILYTLNSGCRGGMEKHVGDLAAGMVRKGHHVYIWCKSGCIVKAYKDAGAQVTETKIGLEIDPVYIFSLCRFLRRNRIDVVHAHEVKAVANTLLAAFFAGTKVKISHTHTPISTWRIKPLLKLLDIIVDTTFVNIFSSREIALTQSIKKQKMKEGISEGKLEVIPNGLGILDALPLPEERTAFRSERGRFRSEITRRYEISPMAFVIGVVGRLTEEKGHFILVQAFKRFVENDCKGARLLVVGGGKLENEIYAQCKKLEISDKVTITGEFAEEDKAKYYLAFDLFVHPTLTEGFGYVLLEAIYFGLPVVCSDLEVLHEVGGSDAVFFKTGDAGDLYEKMCAVYGLIKNGKFQEESEVRVLAARQRAKSLFSMEKFTKSYEDLYSKLMGECR